MPQHPAKVTPIFLLQMGNSRQANTQVNDAGFTLCKYKQFATLSRVSIGHTFMEISI